jgi:Protein of unknown function (DUF3618)
MTTSEQLEREAEQHRAEIAQTLQELRSRMTPGQVVDQLVDYARDGSGGMFLHNLRRQAVDNPLPLVMVGTGLAWLMMNGRHSTASSSATSDPGSGSRDKAVDAKDGLANKVGDAKEAVADASTSASASLKGAASSAYDAAAEAADRATDAISNSASSVRNTASSTVKAVMDFFKEQPLALAGIGLALGAAIGASLPATETEDELMGDASDNLKARAGDLASEQLDKAETVAERVHDDAMHEAAKQGVASDASDQSRTAQPMVQDRADAPTLVPATDEPELGNTSKDAGVPEDVSSNR